MPSSRDPHRWARSLAGVTTNATVLAPSVASRLTSGSLDHYFLWSPNGASEAMRTVRSVTEFLSIELRDDGPVFVCRCGYVLGDARVNFKALTLMEEGPVHDAGLRVNPYGVGGRFVFRQFYCPGCVVRLETEVALKDEPVLWDIEIQLS